MPRISQEYRAHFHRELDTLLDNVHVDTETRSILHLFNPGPDSTPNICIVAYGPWAQLLTEILDRFTVPSDPGGAPN